MKLHEITKLVIDQCQMKKQWVIHTDPSWLTAAGAKRSKRHSRSTSKRAACFMTCVFTSAGTATCPQRPQRPPETLSKDDVQ